MWWQPVSMLASDVPRKWSWWIDVHCETYWALFSTCDKKREKKPVARSTICTLAMTGQCSSISFVRFAAFIRGGGEEPPSMKLTKIALSCFAHFYIYSSANTTQNQFTYFDGLPLKQVFCINSIVHSSCESTFHVWQYSFWWWSECFTIKLNHFLGQSLSQA